MAYDDILDIYWKVWGDQWEDKLDHLEATFTDASHPARVRRRPRSLRASGATPGSTEARPRWSRAARFSVDDVHTGPVRRDAGRRAPRPRAGRQRRARSRRATGSRTSSTRRAPRPTTSTARPRRPSASSATTRPRSRWASGSSACRADRVHAAGARARGRTSVPEHLPEPPDDASPALAYGLAHEGGDSDDTVLATLLDLVDRGYYDAKTVDAEKEKLDLSLKVASKRPSGEARAPREGGPRLLRRAARRRHRRDERDEGPDPRAQRHLARALGDDDHGARHRSTRPAQVGPQPQREALADGARPRDRLRARRHRRLVREPGVAPPHRRSRSSP